MAEKDLAQEIVIKTDLCIEGLRIEESALEGVGTRYKENINWLFDYDFTTTGLSPDSIPPQEIKLPLGTMPPVRLNVRSPYQVRKEDGTLILEKGGKFLTTLEWAKRPRYYDQLTSDGVLMQKVGIIIGDRCLAICFNTYCINWKDGKQCRFCNFNYTHQQEDDYVLKYKKTQQIGEVAARARESGIAWYLAMSSGTLPGSKTTDHAIMVVESIKEHTGLERIPGFISFAPPSQLKDLDRLYEAGLAGACHNLEVWDPHLFRAICPGKAEQVGRERFLEALEYEVSLFGRGYVNSAFVMGMECKDSLLEGAQYLAERGVLPIAFPWVPMKGSKLEGHRPPTLEWNLEVTEKLVDIIEAYMPDVFEDFFLAKDKFSSWKQIPITPVFDEIRRRLAHVSSPDPKGGTENGIGGGLMKEKEG